jgi:ankyrin repeat protein
MAVQQSTPRGLNGRTALMAAALRNQDNIITLLLDNGAEANATDRTGATALILAATQGHLKAVNVLIAHEANVNARDNLGCTPLMGSMIGRHVAVEDVLRRHKAQEGKPEARLILAAQSGDIIEVKNALAQGAQINAKTVAGDTALLLSVDGGHAEITDILLQAEADVNLKGARGRTPLMVAVQKGKSKLVKALVTAGACETVEAVAPFGRDCVGHTAATLALSLRHVNIARFLANQCGSLLPDDTVSTAMYGDRYHLKHCLWLKRGGEQKTLDEVLKKGLLPCTRCFKRQ